MKCDQHFILRAVCVIFAVTMRVVTYPNATHPVCESNPFAVNKLHPYPRNQRNTTAVNKLLRCLHDPTVRPHLHYTHVYATRLWDPICTKPRSDYIDRVTLHTVNKRHPCRRNHLQSITYTHVDATIRS